MQASSTNITHHEAASLHSDYGAGYALHVRRESVLGDAVAFRWHKAPAQALTIECWVQMMGSPSRPGVLLAYHLPEAVDHEASGFALGIFHKRPKVLVDALRGVAARHATNNL